MLLSGVLLTVDVFMIVLVCVHDCACMCACMVCVYGVWCACMVYSRGACMVYLLVCSRGVCCLQSLEDTVSSIIMQPQVRPHELQAAHALRGRISDLKLRAAITQVGAPSSMHVTVSTASLHA